MRRDKHAAALVQAHGFALGRRTKHGYLVVDPATGAIVASCAGTPGDVRSTRNLIATLSRYRRTHA